MDSKKAGKPKVLIVDDNVVNLLVAQRLLEAQGYDVFVALTIWEAARQLEQCHVDVLVTDVVLERGSFHELHRMMTLNGRESAPYRAVIVMSGTMTMATQQAFWHYAELIHGFVQKAERTTPQGEGTVSEQTLVVAVRSALTSIGVGVPCT